MERTELKRSTPLRSTRPTPRRRRWQCKHCKRLNDAFTKSCQCGIGRDTKRTSLKARCDNLASYLTKALADFKCARCGKAGEPDAKGRRVRGLDWSHRFKRRFHSVRWDLLNADALCRECHEYFETRPMEYAAWYSRPERHNPANADELEQRANEPWDKDYAAILAYLHLVRDELRKKENEA